MFIYLHKCRSRAVVGGGDADDIATCSTHKTSIFIVLSPLGWPMRSTTTLTDSGWATGAAWTSLYGGRSGRDLPVPGKPNDRRRLSYKLIADRLCPSLGHLPGWRTPGPYPSLGPSLHAIEPIPNQLGVCNAENLLDHAMTGSRRSKSRRRR